MGKKKLTLVGEYPVPQGEDEARAVANNALFMAQHQQNLKDGFVPVGEISASAGAEEQTAFHKEVVRRIRQMERGESQA